MARETGQQGFRRAGTYQENELKICDLCGSLNLSTNRECFICGWSGRFELNQEVVHTAVEIAIQLYGRLELENLTDIQTYCAKPQSLTVRIRAWVARVWQWLSG
jgi:hypothetical protein